jgi:hypothetical protein
MFTDDDWYSLHFVQVCLWRVIRSCTDSESNNPAIHYMKQVKSWLVQHPNGTFSCIFCDCVLVYVPLFSFCSQFAEIVVFWLSKHGNNCATGDNQYPGVSNATKQGITSWLYAHVLIL